MEIASHLVPFLRGARAATQAGKTTARVTQVAIHGRNADGTYQVSVRGKSPVNLNEADVAAITDMKPEEAVRMIEAGATEALTVRGAGIPDAQPPGAVVTSENKSYTGQALNMMTILSSPGAADNRGDLRKCEAF